MLEQKHVRTHVHTKRTWTWTREQTRTQGKRAREWDSDLFVFDLQRVPLARFELLQF